MKTSHRIKRKKYATPKRIPNRNDFLAETISLFIERRKELGLTQEDVDARMGTADRLCSKWECGERMPNSFNFFCWAQALDAQLILVAKHEMPQ